MCGLNGVFGEVGLKERAVFSSLSMFSQLRGKDSTGVGLVYKDSAKKKPVIAKAIGGQESLVYDNLELFDIDSWILSDKDIECVIGHNRWATVGKVTKANAHPFRYNDVIGCHNGTVKEWELTDFVKKGEDLTDSQILLRELSKGTTASDMVEYLDGAWAFVWYDLKKKELNFCRNKERSLFLTFSKTKKTIFWASEEWMLRVALSRGGVPFGDILDVNKDKHLTYKINKEGLVELINVEDTPSGKWKNWGNWGINQWGNYKGPKEKATNEVSDDSSVYEDEDFEYNYAETVSGRWVPRRRYESLLKDGCAMCTGDLSWENREQIRWQDMETPLCLDCHEHEKEERKVG